MCYLLITQYQIGLAYFYNVNTNISGERWKISFSVEQYNSSTGRIFHSNVKKSHLYQFKQWLFSNHNINEQWTCSRLVDTWTVLGSMQR